MDSPTARSPDSVYSQLNKFKDVFIALPVREGYEVSVQA